MPQTTTQTCPTDTGAAAGTQRISFISLGCPKNLVDSEKMLGTLIDSGFELVPESEPAEAIIINTCGFLEASKEESLEVIREAIERKERGEVSRVIVAGCLVQRHRAKLLEWAPGIDAMIGVFDRDHIIDAVGNRNASRGLPDVGSPDLHSTPLPKYWITSNALLAARDRGLDTIGLTVNGKDGRGVGYFEDDAHRFRLTPHHWAYLRISEGCNQKCAFCTIPSIRGKMRSKPLDRIINEARALMDDGAFEINLIGQDTTSYGYDIYRTDETPDLTTNGRKVRVPNVIAGANEYPGNLIGLLEALNDLADAFGGRWIRLMYVYPTHFTDEMIEAIARLPNIVKYIDIPLQHITDKMLRAMRRNITRAQQEALLETLRGRIPGLAIRTTLITGFPGETEDDHRELVQFIDDFGFDMLGVFQYSREDGTPAGTMDLDPQLHVPDEVKAEREAELMLTQQHIAFENAAYLAERRAEFDVLLERTSPVSSRGYPGRAYFQAPQVDSVAYVRSAAPRFAGELLRCTIVDSDGYDLIAQPTGE